MTDAPQKTAFERHAQTIIGGLILAAVLWSATTIQSLSVSVATLTTQVSSLQREINALQGQTVDRYTKQDAARDWSVRDAQIQDHRERIRALEKK
jgi:outer membrane murein-binding lipoprotein Lpp